MEANSAFTLKKEQCTHFITNFIRNFKPWMFRKHHVALFLTSQTDSFTRGIENFHPLSFVCMSLSLTFLLWICRNFCGFFRQCMFSRLCVLCLSSHICAPFLPWLNLTYRSSSSHVQCLLSGSHVTYVTIYKRKILGTYSPTLHFFYQQTIKIWGSYGIITSKNYAMVKRIKGLILLFWFFNVY